MRPWAASVGGAFITRGDTTKVGSDGKAPSACCVTMIGPFTTSNALATACIGTRVEVYFYFYLVLNTFFPGLSSSCRLIFLPPSLLSLCFCDCVRFCLPSINNYALCICLCLSLSLAPSLSCRSVSVSLTHLSLTRSVCRSLLGNGMLGTKREGPEIDFYPVLSGTFCFL